MASSNSSEAKSAQRKSHRLNEKKKKKAARSSERLLPDPLMTSRKRKRTVTEKSDLTRTNRLTSCLRVWKIWAPTKVMVDRMMVLLPQVVIASYCVMRNLLDLDDSENSSSSSPSSAAGGRRRQGKRGKEIYSDREAFATVEDARSYTSDIRSYVMLMAKKSNVWSKRNHAEMRDWGTILELMRKRVGFSDSDEAYRFAARRFVAIQHVKSPTLILEQGPKSSK
eukprot:g8177.t1